MGLSASQAAVLEELLAVLPDDGTWCLFGSTDTVLRGLDDDPSDVDVLAMASTAGRFRETFPDDFVGTREVGRSQVDSYEIDGEEVEVIFARKAKDYQRPLVPLADVEFDRENELGAPLLPLDRLLDAYERIDRRETAERLRAAFERSDG